MGVPGRINAQVLADPGPGPNVTLDFGLPMATFRRDRSAKFLNSR